MEDLEIRLCEICQVNELKPSQSKYCGKVCYHKAIDIKQRLKKLSFKPEPKRNPVWVCPNGHKTEIKFDIKKDKVRWSNHKCWCGASTRDNAYDKVSL